MKHAGKSASEPQLDSIYYLPSPKQVIKNSSQDYCAHFRAGDNHTKARFGVDVNGIFGADCVHGFPYRIIGNSNSDFVLVFIL